MDILKKQLKLVENYLLEFCEVNGIPESALKEHLTLISHASDKSIMVVASDNWKDVKFGVRQKEGFIEVFGKFLEHECNFSTTAKLIRKNGICTGNATVASGEQRYA